MYYLAKDRVAFNAVECKGFLLLHKLEPKYTMPATPTFSRDRCVKLFDTTCEALLQEFSEIVSFASTSPQQPPWHALHTCGSHRRGTLWLYEGCMLDYWHLDIRKHTMITTDNGANILKACRDLDWCNVLHALDIIYTWPSLLLPPKPRDYHTCLVCVPRRKSPSMAVTRSERPSRQLKLHSWNQMTKARLRRLMRMMVLMKKIDCVVNRYGTQKIINLASVRFSFFFVFTSILSFECLNMYAFLQTIAI